MSEAIYLVLLLGDISIGFSVHLHSCGLGIKIRVHSWKFSITLMHVHSWKFVIWVCDKKNVIFICMRLKVLCEITNILAMPVGESQNRWFIYTKYIDMINYSGGYWEDHPLMSIYSLATVQCKEQLTP